MDGWTLPGPPGPAGAGGQSSATGWERAQSAPFVETPITTTDDTVYTGFGFEAVDGAANRPGADGGGALAPGLALAPGRQAGA